MHATTDRLNSALAGRYRIERELGAGGMATVYLAQDLRHDRHVAIKVLKPELAAVLGAERFVQEIKTTAALQHPHILPLFDSGTADGFLFFVMPYIEGETLRTRLNRDTQLGVDESVRMAREVADALDYAHRHGVIHRDIKPENILLHDGRPMVADFGIALAVSAAAGGRMTETGLSLGTPHYMSPEQATAEKEITARSDIYSLSSVLYEMLTGNPPHVGASAQQIIMKIITEPAESVNKFRKSVPPNVAAAVAKSLEKLPADRFETAKAFAEALVNPSYAGSVVAPPSPTGEVGTRSRLELAINVGAIALVIATTALVTSWLSARPDEESVPVLVAFSTKPIQPLVNASGRNVVLSPDGNLVVFASADSVGRIGLFSRRLDDARLVPMEGTGNGRFPFFSPDGATIGFFDGRQLRKIALGDMTPTPLADMSAGFQGATWSAMGIIVSIGGRFSVVPSDGGKPTPLLPGDSLRGYWPVMLSDNRHLLFQTALSTTDGKVAVLDLTSKRWTNLGVTGMPVGVVEDQLVYLRADQVLMVMPFDVNKQAVSGSARVVRTDVQRSALSQAKASLSSTGSLAYVTGSGIQQIVSVDLRGFERALPIASGRHSFPRLSPNGKQLLADAFAGGKTDVWVYDIATGSSRRVTSEGNTNHRAEWTADGKSILYRADPGNGNSTYLIQPADGVGASRRLVAVPGVDVWEALLTPDQRTVIYRTGTLGGSDIWYRALTGDTTPKIVANSPFNEIAIALSPDGRWIAYQTDASQAMEVVVRPFPGPGPEHPVSIGGGQSPVWSRDGRKLFYVNGNSMLMATVSTTPTFAVTSRRTMFEGNFFQNQAHASYDVSADGMSLLMHRPVSGNDEQLVIIHNWKAQLRASAAQASQR